MDKRIKLAIGRAWLLPINIIVWMLEFMESCVEEVNRDERRRREAQRRG